MVTYRSLDDKMRLAGYLLLPAGWAIVLAAVWMLRAPASVATFVLAGLGVELLGAGLMARTYVIPRSGPR